MPNQGWLPLLYVPSCLSGKIDLWKLCGEDSFPGSPIAFFLELREASPARDGFPLSLF